MQRPNNRPKVLLLISLIAIILVINPQHTMSQPANETLQTIHGRTSIRSFTDEVVPSAMIETLLRAAMAAPSSRNVQPWLFYVVEDRALLTKLSEELPSARMLAHAPVAIVVCGDTRKGDPNPEQVHNWVMDCSAATQNLLLAAHSLGLGAVWTGVYPYAERISTVRTALGLPEHIIPLNVVPVGFPSVHGHPKDKWDENKVIFHGKE